MKWSGGEWRGDGDGGRHLRAQGEPRGAVPGPSAHTLSPGTPRPGPATSSSPAGCSQHRAGLPSPGWSRPSSSHLLSELGIRETLPHPLLGATSSLLAPGAALQGAGRGRSHGRAPRQLREGAGWVLAWARKRRDPLLSPAANAKSIRHVSAPRGNRLRPAEGSSQGRGRRLGGSAQGGRPGMCRVKAQKAADILHPPPQPAPSCPALEPCPEGCGAPAAPGGRRQRVPLGDRLPPLWQLPCGLCERGSQLTAHPWRNQSLCPAPGGAGPGRRQRCPSGSWDSPRGSGAGSGRCRGDAERDVEVVGRDGSATGWSCPGRL